MRRRIHTGLPRHSTVIISPGLKLADVRLHRRTGRLRAFGRRQAGERPNRGSPLRRRHLAADVASSRCGGCCPFSDQRSRASSQRKTKDLDTNNHPIISPDAAAEKARRPIASRKQGLRHETDTDQEPPGACVAALRQRKFRPRGARSSPADGADVGMLSFAADRDAARQPADLTPRAPSRLATVTARWPRPRW